MNEKSNRAAQLKLLDELCDQFETQWQSGQHPELNTFLLSVPDSQRSETLRELLVLELNYLRDRGEQPGVAEYESLYHDDVDTVRQAFLDVYSDKETHGVSDTIGLSPAAAITLPDQFNDYEIVGEIARGGMGAVFEARQLSLERTVALKVILAGELATQEMVERFLSEAKAAAKLQHPGIVGVHEVDQINGQYYFSMEYVSGKSLSSLVQAAPTAPLEAARYVKDVADALHYAHEQGVLHRDVKPSNIMIDDTGRTRIMDFGLAKVIKSDSGLTVDGQLLGTPSYMAPEQARGEVSKVDRRSDVYALGAVLYALLTGRPPHDGESPMDTVMQVIGKEPTPPTQLVASLDSSIEAICLKCMSKNPADRYATAADLSDALTAFLNHERPTPVRTKTWAMAGVAVTTLTLVLLTVVLLFRTKDGTIRVELMPGVSEDVQIEFKSNGVVQIADAKSGWMVNVKKGQYAVSVKGGSAEFKLSSQTLTISDNGKERVVVSLRKQNKPAASVVAASTKVIPPDPPRAFAVGEPLGQNSLVRSPAKIDNVDSWTFELDGHRNEVTGIAFKPDATLVATMSRDGSIRIWHTASAICERVLVSPSFALTGTWSADGKMLATFCNDTKIRVWDVGRSQLVKTVESRARDVTVLTWSPRVVELAGGMRDGSIKIWDLLSGKTKTTLADHKGAVRSLSWSPDGKYLASGGADKKAFIFDVATWNRRYSLDQHMGPVNGLAWSADSTQLASACDDKTVRVWSVDSGDLMETHARQSEPVSAVQFRKDGQHLLAVLSNGSGVLIKRGPKDGELVRTFARGEQTVNAFRWSPDGRTVVSSGKYGAVTIRNTETGEERRNAGYLIRYATSTYNRSMPPVAWSPGGAKIAFGTPSNVHKPQGQIGIWNLKAGPLVTAMRTGHFFTVSLDWQPNGRQLASGGSELQAILWNEQGKAQKRLSTGGWVTVRYSPDGKRIASRNQAGSIVIFDVATGKVNTRVGHRALLGSLSWSPDSKQVASGGTDNTVKIWDAKTGKNVRTIKIEGDGVRHSLDWSPGGNRLVGSGAGKLWVWDASSGKKLKTIAGHAGWVTCARFSPDGKLLASCDQHGLIQLWNSQSFAKLREIRCPSRFLRHICWSPDSRLLAGGTDEAKFFVWDATNGASRGEFIPLTNQMGVGVTPQGHLRISAKLDAKVVYIVRTKNGQLNLSRDQFQQRFGWQNRTSKLVLVNQ